MKWNPGITRIPWLEFKSMAGRFCIACGGSGGHLFPGLAVAERLHARGHQVRLYISTKSVDTRIMEGYPQFEAHALPSIGWPGLGFHVASFAWRLWSARQICMKEVLDFRPHGVLAMGGFTSVAPLWAALAKDVPSFIHEANTIPGKVTRKFARKVQEVFLAFDETSERLHGSHCTMVGMPLRKCFQKIPREEAARQLGLDSRRPTLIVLGGSQGAVSLNHLVCNSIDFLRPILKDWQVIHLTGVDQDASVREAYRQHNISAVVFPFSHEMCAIYSMADVAVSRCGASSLAELSFFGLPSLLVPYQHAADDHQSVNAGVYMRAGAALVFDERYHPVENFGRHLLDLLEKEELRKNLSQASANLNHPDAADVVVKELEHVIS